jgi:trimeric autotransporter adhesin
VKERGTAKINVSANEMHAGMYLYTLIIDGKPIDTKRMILTE